MKVIRKMIKRKHFGVWFLALVTALAGSIFYLSMNAHAQQDFDSLSVKELLASEDKLTWVFAGDSITHVANYTYNMNGYSEYFEQRLYELGREDDTVINTAIGGKTISDIRTNLATYITNYNPDVVFIKIGMNDRRTTTLDTFRTDFEAVLKGTYEAGARNGKIPKIILISTTPRSSDTLLNREQENADSCWPWRDAVEEIAKDNDLMFIDFLTPFVEMQQIYGDNYHSLFFSDASDGATHPNQAGQYLMFQIFSRAMEIYDETSPLYQLEYEDLNDAPLWVDDEIVGMTDSSELDEADIYEILKSAPKIDEKTPVGSYSFTLNDNKALDASGYDSVVDMTSGFPQEALSQLEKTFTYVVRVKTSNAGGKSQQPVLYVTMNDSLAFGATSTSLQDQNTMLALGIDGSSAVNYYKIMGLGASMSSYNGTTKTNPTVGQAAADGEWHTLVFRQEADGYSYFIDGVEVSLGTAASSLRYMSKNFGDYFTSDAVDYKVWFGRYNTDNRAATYMFSGLANYAALYKEALTDEEIISLCGDDYASGGAQGPLSDEQEMNQTMPTLTETSALGYYDFSASNGVFTGKYDEAIDLSKIEGDGQLTLDKVQQMGKEYTYVVRAKLGSASSSSQGVLYMTTSAGEVFNNKGTNNNSLMLGVPAATATPQFYVKVSKDGYTSQASGMSTGLQVPGTNYATDNEWHTFIFRQESDTYTIYVDGKVAYTSPCTLKTSIGDLFADSYITEFSALVGRYNGNSSTDGTKNYALNGKVDYVQFYGTSISDEEVRLLSAQDMDDTSGDDTYDEITSAGWATATKAYNVWAIAGGKQMSSYENVTGQRSMVHHLENVIRYTGYTSIRVINASAPSYDVAYLTEHYEELIGQYNPDVFLLLPEVSKVYESDYSYAGQSELAAYKKNVIKLLQESKASVKILMTPLPSADETINTYISAYAKVVREIAEENPKLLFYDANAFVSLNMSNASTLRNWFGNDGYLTTAGAHDFALAFLTYANNQGMGMAVENNLGKWTFRESTDGKYKKSSYRNDHIEAAVSTNGMTVTVDASAILAEYPNLENLTFKLLPYAGCGNYNEEIVTFPNVTANGNSYSFTVPYEAAAIGVYGEQNGLTYRFADLKVKLELSGISGADIQAAIAAIYPDTQPGGCVLDGLSVVGAELNFDPSVKEYNVPLYQYQRQIQVNATAHEKLSITVKGNAVENGAETLKSGVNSSYINVELGGDCDLVVSVTDGAAVTDYTLHLTRSEYPDIIVTEVIVNGSNETVSGISGDAYDMIEIYNASGHDLNLKDYSIGYKRDYLQTQLGGAGTNGNAGEWPYYFTGNDQAFSGTTVNYTGINQITKYSTYWDGSLKEPESIVFPADSTMVIWVKYSPSGSVDARKDYGAALTYETLLKNAFTASNTLSVETKDGSSLVTPDLEQIVLAEVPVGAEAEIPGSRITENYDTVSKYFLLNNITSEQSYKESGSTNSQRGWLFLLGAGAQAARNGSITESGNDIISAANYLRPYTADDGSSTILVYDVDRGMSVVRNAGTLASVDELKYFTSDEQSYHAYSTIGAIEYFQKPLNLGDNTPAVVRDETETFVYAENAKIQLNVTDDTDIRYLELYVRAEGQKEYTKLSKDLVLLEGVENKGKLTAHVLSYAYEYDLPSEMTDGAGYVEYYGYVIDGNNHKTLIATEADPARITFVDTSLIVEADTASVPMGGRFTITVTAKDIPSLSSLEAVLTNDASEGKLELVSYDAEKGVTFDTDTGKLTWTEDITTITSRKLLTLNYHIVGNWEGQIHFEFQNLSMKAADKTSTEARLEGTDIRVLANYLLTAGTDNATIGTGAMVQIPLTITENNVLKQIEFSVSWNASALEYAGYVANEKYVVIIEEETGTLHVFMDSGESSLSKDVLTLSFEVLKGAQAGKEIISVTGIRAVGGGTTAPLSGIDGSVNLSNLPYLLISEVVPDSLSTTGASNDQFEYLELYNPNDFDVPLHDVGLYVYGPTGYGATPIWDFTYSYDGGGKPTAITSMEVTTKTIPAHSYFIVWSVVGTEWVNTNAMLDISDFADYYDDAKTNQAIAEGRYGFIMRPTAAFLNRTDILTDMGDNYNQKSAAILDLLRAEGWENLPVVVNGKVSCEWVDGCFFNLPNSLTTASYTYYVGDLDQYAYLGTTGSSGFTGKDERAFAQYYSCLTTAITPGYVANRPPSQSAIYPDFSVGITSETTDYTTTGVMGAATAGCGSKSTAIVTFSGTPESADVSMPIRTSSFELGSGTYTATISADGYQSKQLVFTVTENDVILGSKIVEYILETSEKTVVFDSCGGSYVAYRSAGVSGTVQLPEEQPEKYGYTFTGWYLDASCTQKADFPLAVTKSMVLYAGWDVESTDEGNGYQMVYHTADDVMKYLNSDKSDYPKEKAGYLFAGWYKSKDHYDINNAIVSAGDVPESGAYALYVPEEILGVKAQISSNLLDRDLENDAYGAIRFVTSVNSLNYKDAGFFFIIEGGAGEFRRSNGLVYEKLFGIRQHDIDKEDVLVYTPGATFHSLSKYFKTHAFVEIPESQYDLKITAVPFWETLDGTIVRGNPVTKCINDGKGNYVVTNYGELKAALEDIEERDIQSEAVITLAGDIEIPEKVTVNPNRNIVLQDDGTVRKILRSDSFKLANNSRGVLFDVSANASLTFKSTGSSEEPRLIIDGNKETHREELEALGSGNWAIINALSGSLNVRIYAGVQFQNNISSGAGAVLRMESGSGTLLIDGGIFKDNEGMNSHGGAINIATTTQATIKNTIFSGNKGKNAGALVCNTGSNVSLEGCEFSGNSGSVTGGSTAVQGGVMYCYADSNVSIIDCKFIGNAVTATGGSGNAQGGVLFAAASSTVSIEECEFSGNEATVIGGEGLATGGALCCYRNSNVSILECKFTDNIAAVKNGTNEARGGAMYCDGTTTASAHVSIIDSVFSENKAETGTTNKGYGGVATVYNIQSDGVVFSGCTFERNEASEGGAVNVPGGHQVALAYCTFANNKTTKAATAKMPTWGNDVRLGSDASKIYISGKMVVDILPRAASCVYVTGALTAGSDVVLNWCGKDGTNRIPASTAKAIAFSTMEIMNTSKTYIKLGNHMPDGYVLKYSESEPAAYCVSE